MDGRMHTGVAMFFKKLKELGLFHEVQLARLAGLRSRFVWGSRHGCVQSYHLARLGNLEDEGLALARSRRQFHAALAQDVNATACLAFDEQGRTRRVSEGELYLLKGFHLDFRQTTEKALRTEVAGETVLDQFHAVW